MNAPLPLSVLRSKCGDMGLSTFRLDQVNATRAERRVQIERYLDHKSQARFCRAKEAETGFDEWLDVAGDELALASHCRKEALRLGRELRDGGRM